MNDEILGPIYFIDYARRYIKAAAHLREDGELLQPRYQLWGQALELALKAFLSKHEHRPWPQTHDLVKLMTLAEPYGLELSERDRKNVITNLNKMFFLSEPDGRKFASRYPVPGTSIWITPTPEWVEDTVNMITDQSRED